MIDVDPQVKVLSHSPTYRRCVNAPALPFLAIRDEYIALTSCPCAAALLNVFEHWTNLRLMAGEDTWIVRTHDQLVEALRGIWSAISVRRALKRLVDVGFLQLRPGEGFDRRSRWRFVAECVQSALEQIFPSDQEIKSNESMDSIEGSVLTPSIESPDQIDLIRGADDSYIDSLYIESFDESFVDSTPPDSRARAHEGGGGPQTPSSELQNSLQKEGRDDKWSAAFDTRDDAPHPLSPPSPPPNVMSAAWTIARAAYDAGRVKTTMEQYAAGIVSRMMLERREVVPAPTAYGQATAGRLEDVIIE